MLSKTSPLWRTNIPSEFFRFGLDLFETLLHDVADADDSMKCSILNDGQMPVSVQRDANRSRGVATAADRRKTLHISVGRCEKHTSQAHFLMNY